MKRKIIYILLAIVLISGLVGYNFYQKIASEAVIKDTDLYIKSNTSFDDLTLQLTPLLNNINDFKWVAKLKKFSKVKGGRYVLKKGTNTNTLINLLRSGNQTPVKVTFNNQDTLEKLAGRIAQQLETDSLALLSIMKEPSFLKQHQFTEKSVLGMYIPNQYQFYWNDSPEKFRNKMLDYYNKFWTNDRQQKAKNLNLTPQQVITLASIVQKETAKTSERPIVAGLYLNRYKNNWPLQADPTIIYSIKEQKGQDIIIKRVLNKDLEIDSPYNTYKYSGLPPSLIAMPDISSIDAVLNPAKHNYFYMCANIDKIGYHEFATTLTQHNRNAAKYQQWITKKGIKR